MTHVIARYDEDISWSDGLNRFVVQKGVHLPNVGREASSWLWYIVENYDSLEGTYAFRQGNPEGPLHGTMWTSTTDADLQHYKFDSRPLAEFLDVEIPEVLHFVAGAQHDVDADVIRLRSKEWYEKALLAAHIQPQAPWMFERLWPYIWFGKAKPWIPI